MYITVWALVLMDRTRHYINTYLNHSYFHRKNLSPQYMYRVAFMGGICHLPPEKPTSLLDILQYSYYDFVTCNRHSFAYVFKECKLWSLIHKIMCCLPHLQSRFLSLSGFSVYTTK